VSPVDAPTNESDINKSLKKREKRDLQSITSSLLDEKSKSDEQKAFHKWLVKEQQAYIAKYGPEDFEKVNWDKYGQDYYPGNYSEARFRVRHRKGKAKSLITIHCVVLDSLP